VNDRLFRSQSDRMLAGVAGGLAEMWDADPSLIRIVWALLVVLTGGLALVVYIVMAIVVPEEDEVWPATPAAPAAGAATAAATAGTAPSAEGAPAVTDPATGSALVTPAPEPGAMWASPPVQARRAARIEARAARRAARGDGGGLGVSGTVIGGLVLVALGVFFLAREWLPQIDFDWFWPSMLIVLGVVLLVAALGRKPKDPGSVS
jgi:phage shock protein C